jgi:hypothetical protein
VTLEAVEPMRGRPGGLCQHTESVLHGLPVKGDAAQIEEHGAFLAGLFRNGEDRLFPEIRENWSMGSWVRSLADRAGIVLWKKPFQNMRATCATDLADRYPGHVCEAWLGHMGKIADKHYRQVTESHFERAAGIKHTENRIVDVQPPEAKIEPRKKTGQITG